MKALTFPKAVFTKFSSRSFIILALVGVLFSLSAIPAFACAAQPSPNSYPKYTLKERIDHVSHVFSGTIIDMEDGDTAVAVVRVTNYYKGSGPETVRVNGFARGADCQEFVSKGQQLVFFVSGSPEQGFHAPSTLDVPNYIKPTEPTSGQLYNDIVQATGNQPSVPYPDAQIQEPQQRSTPANPEFALGYFLFTGNTGLFVGGVLFYLILQETSYRY